MKLTWTKPDADNLVFQCIYARNYGQRLARFYKRSGNMIRVIQMLAGSAGFSVILTQSTSIAIWSGAVIALLSAVDIIWNPSEKGILCSIASTEWGKLAAEAHTKTYDEFLANVTTLQSDDMPSWDCLNYIVHYDTLKELGRDDEVKPLTRWQAWTNRFF